MSPSLRTQNGRPGLATYSIVSTPFFNCAYHLNICAPDKQLSPYTCLINSKVSAAVFPNLKQNLMFALCSMPLCDHVLLLPAQHGAVFPVMLSMGHCCVARLQMKIGHMDGMCCFIDSTSLLVKIKSVSLYNFRTVYNRNCSCINKRY